MSNLDDNKKWSPLEEETSSFVETIKKFKQSFEIDIPNQHKVLYDELAKTGWYIDYNLAPKTLAGLILLDYEKMSYLDKYLIDYFQKQSSSISKKFRDFILTEKSLSIPLSKRIRGKSMSCQYQCF